MLPTIVRHVSNRGPATPPGDPSDVWFVTSTETFDEARLLKNELDSIDPGRTAVIFRSLVRYSPTTRASHETWHIDAGEADSAAVTESDVDPIGFDVFTAPRDVVSNAQKNWDRGVLCARISTLLHGCSQTGNPGGAQ